MDWNNEIILRFLKLYKMHPCVWNTKHKLHRTRDKVHEAWLDIQKNMQIPCTVAQLKKKKESLMSAYRAYKTKIKNSAVVSGGSVYKPSWFAFETMDSFLSPVYLGSSTPNTNWNNFVVYHPENEPNIEIITDSARLNEDTNPSESDQEITKTKPKGTKRPHTPEHTSNSPYHENNETKREFYANQYEIQDDECDIIAKLWARKLRKLPEERRDILIYKINSIIYKESINNHRSASPGVIISSPVQIKEENSSDNCYEEERESPAFADTNFESDTLYEGSAKVFETIKLGKRQ